MNSTREKILKTLLTFPKSTINELAEAVGINGISVRHHLKALEAEDLVSSEEERHGVGRPRLIYTLTDKGVEEFPTSYLLLTKRLLALLAKNMSPAEMEALFQDIGMMIAAQHQGALSGKSSHERLRLLESVMTKEGFIVDIENGDSAYSLDILACPYHRIGVDHPEICALDQTLIANFLVSPIKIESCILHGDDRCTYRIPIKTEG